MVMFWSVPERPKKPPDPDGACVQEGAFERDVELHCVKGDVETSCDKAPKSEAFLGWRVLRASKKPPDPSGDCDLDIDFEGNISPEATSHSDSPVELRTISSNSSSSPRSATRTARLSDDIPDEMCQGVSLKIVLERFGDQLNKTSAIRTSSHRVSRYDAFISHDWATMPCLKVLSLILVYNSAPAAACAFVACFVLAVLEIFDVLPRDDECYWIGGHLCTYRGIWGWPLSMSVYAVMLCFWERIRNSCGKSHVVFFDKLCIPQSDAVRKTQAIRGLAGFLRRSDALVVLWSPVYFSRLWCSYELASWLNFQGKRVVVMPVSMSLTLCLLMTAVSSFALTLHVLETHRLALGTLVIGFIAAVFFLLVLASVAAERMIADMEKLPAQLSAFSIRDTKCSCCQMNHLDPDSGEPMACDRELVYATLATWFALDDGSTCDECLDAFDTSVKTRLRPEFLKFLRGSSLQYKLFVCTVTPITLCYNVGIVLSVVVLDPALAARLLLELFASAFCISPIGCRLMFATGIAETLGVRLPRWLRVLCRVASIFIWLTASWLPLIPMRQTRSPLPHVIYVIFLSVVTHFAFSPDGWWRAWECAYRCAIHPFFAK